MKARTQRYTTRFDDLEDIRGHQQARLGLYGFPAADSCGVGQSCEAQKDRDNRAGLTQSVDHPHIPQIFSNKIV